MSESRTSPRAGSNGHDPRGVGADELSAVRSEGAAPQEGSRSLPARLGGALKGLLSARIPAADLDERDPDYVREQLPLLWLLVTLWYRAEVRGLGNVPEQGPVLLVGNH